jgi:hypothetical protein
MRVAEESHSGGRSLRQSTRCERPHLHQIEGDAATAGAEVPAPDATARARKITYDRSRISRPLVTSVMASCRQSATGTEGSPETGQSLLDVAEGARRLCVGGARCPRR